MKNFKISLRVMILGLSFIPPFIYATEIRFSGALVAEPCIIAAGDDAKGLDFGSIVDKELYYNSRSQTKPLTLTLTGCSLDIAKTVTITFSGKESDELAGFLAISSGSGSSGIAIGLETLTGEPVLLNKMAPPVALESGQTLIQLRAFLQGEPSAIREHKIINGVFSSIATFSLNYE